MRYFEYRDEENPHTHVLEMLHQRWDNVRSAKRCGTCNLGLLGSVPEFDTQPLRQFCARILKHFESTVGLKVGVQGFRLGLLVF